MVNIYSIWSTPLENNLSLSNFTCLFLVKTWRNFKIERKIGEQLYTAETRAPRPRRRRSSDEKRRGVNALCQTCLLLSLSSLSLHGSFFPAIVAMLCALSTSWSWRLQCLNRFKWDSLIVECITFAWFSGKCKYLFNLTRYVIRSSCGLLDVLFNRIFRWTADENEAWFVQWRW